MHRLRPVLCRCVPRGPLKLLSMTRNGCCSEPLEPAVRGSGALEAPIRTVGLELWLEAQAKPAHASLLGRDHLLLPGGGLTCIIQNFGPPWEAIKQTF